MYFDIIILLNKFFCLGEILPIIGKTISQHTSIAGSFNCNKKTQYDIVFDVVNNKSLEQVKHVMKQNAVYIGTTPTPTLLWSILRSSLTSKKAKFVAVRPNTKALRDICRLTKEGRLKTKIDKKFTLSEIIAAHRYSELSRTCGKVIIQMNE